MATVHSMPAVSRQNKDRHPVWSRVFSEQERKSLTDEDVTAGLQIPAILMGVMVFGFVSIVLSVWLAI